MAKKYGAKAQKKIEKVMREFKAGTLKSGRGGKKVRSRKQAVAIGISEARKSGAKVPAAHFMNFPQAELPQETHLRAPVFDFEIETAETPGRHQLLNVDLIFQRLFA